MVGSIAVGRKLSLAASSSSSGSAATGGWLSNEIPARQGPVVRTEGNCAGLQKVLVDRRGELSYCILIYEAMQDCSAAVLDCRAFKCNAIKPESKHDDMPRLISSAAHC